MIRRGQDRYRDGAAYDLGFDLGAEFITTSIRIGFESPSHPPEIRSLDLVTGEQAVLKRMVIPSGHDPQDYVVERITLPADDGTAIPVTLLSHRGAPRDGAKGVLLYAMGPMAFRSKPVSSPLSCRWSIAASPMPWRMCAAAWSAARHA